ncbi:MAG TPA: hypothetical protein VFF32_04920 [Dermatophilaceae bacterium]|nr:hypothetical protein [Dermatophilaceae bacterium]
MHLPPEQLFTRSAITRRAGVVMVAVLLVTACNAADDIEPSSNPSPTPAATQIPEPDAKAPEPDPEFLDEDIAAGLYIAWRETVYGLPSTKPEAVDVEAAADTLAVPDSQASDWVTRELELARDRGVIVRGGVHAEPISAVQVTGGRATVPICSSADVRVTDVVTGEPVGEEPVDASYTRFDVTFRRVDDDWLVERADPGDKRDCLPPSIERTVLDRWELFTAAWYERDRLGGGEELGPLTDVVTDRFADVLRGLPPRDPVPAPAPFTDFELATATRTTATGHACRSGGLETIDWVLADGQWRVDFAGQAGEELTPCP